MEGVVTAGLGRGGSWAVMPLQQRSRPVPRGALQLGWTCRTVSSWGMGAGPFPINQSFNVGHPQEGAGLWAPVSQGNRLGEQGLSCRLSAVNTPVGGILCVTKSTPTLRLRDCINTCQRPRPKGLLLQEDGAHRPGYLISSPWACLTPRLHHKTTSSLADVC